MPSSSNHQLWESARRRYFPSLTLGRIKGWRITFQSYQGNTASESQFWESLCGNWWTFLSELILAIKEKSNEINSSSLSVPWTGKSHYIPSQLKTCYHVNWSRFCSFVDVSQGHFWGSSYANCKLNYKADRSKRLQNWCNKWELISICSQKCDCPLIDDHIED